MALSVNNVVLPDLTGIVINPAAARVLGKALFWYTRLGSDNLASASSHFQCRCGQPQQNHLGPGLLRVSDRGRAGNPDTTFGDAIGKTGSGEIADPNYNLTPSDFPLNRTQDMTNRNTPITYDTNDVADTVTALAWA